MTGRRGAYVFTILAALAASSSAQADHIHGIVTSLDGQMLTITSDNAKSVIVQLDPNARIVHNRRLALADIPSGAFVGTFSVITKDKTLRAQGVRVFPDATRGVGEGQYPMASNAERIMTYGSVSGVTPQAGGGVLKVSFHGAGPAGDSTCTGHAPAGGAGCEGSSDIFVARGVPVMSVESGDASLLLPGTVVSADTTTDAGGLSTATVVTIERDAPVPKD